MCAACALASYFSHVSSCSFNIIQRCMAAQVHNYLFGLTAAVSPMLSSLLIGTKVILLRHARRKVGVYQPRGECSKGKVWICIIVIVGGGHVSQQIPHLWSTPTLAENIISRSHKDLWVYAKVQYQGILKNVCQLLAYLLWRVSPLRSTQFNATSLVYLQPVKRGLFRRSRARQAIPANPSGD